ncbi:MAG: hypothetical protein L6R38_004980 [Xanthoria sp. 2 TBL-2021]|nr:MAG: hypothetical protein L6R38_004980 [Xanthoria sp. 2 TBL-2021]
MRLTAGAAIVGYISSSPYFSFPLDSVTQSLFHLASSRYPRLQQVGQHRVRPLRTTHIPFFSNPEDNLEQFIQRLLYGRPTSTPTPESQDTVMPSILPTSRHRHSRHSSAAQKPTSHAPAVVLSPGPTEPKKISNASKAQLRPSRRQGPKSLNDSIPKSSAKADSTTKTKSREELDVFAYMDDYDDSSQHLTPEVDDEDEHHTDYHAEDVNTAASSPVSAHHPTSHYSDLEVNADQQSKRQTWQGGYEQAGSFHSDSGISMGSISTDGDSPAPQHKYPSVRRTSRFSTGFHQPSIPEHHGLTFLPDPFTVQCPAFGADVWSPSKTVPSDTPEAYYAPPSNDVPSSLDTTAFQLPVTPPELSPQLPRSRKHHPAKAPCTKKQGYPQLASTISSQPDSVLKPVYRKFETLNNRILLYLQDEISELESDINGLDAAIIQEEQYLGRTSHSASRRAEAKMPSQLQWRRNELLGRCAGKINQYNQALSSYSSLTKSLYPSSPSDVKAYQKWLTKHTPIAEPEASFIQHRKDLITVSAQAQHTSPLILEYSPVTVALIILTTIIVFKFVPQFFARLVMSAVIGLALMCLVSPASLLDLRLLREKRRGMGVYAAVMLMLAIVVD